MVEDTVLEGGRDGASKLRGTGLGRLVAGFFQLGKRPDGASIFRVFAFFGVGLKGTLINNDSDTRKTLK